MVHARTRPAAQRRTYGVLVGTIRDGREDPAADRSPHYEIEIEAAGTWRVAVNVRSTDGSDVLAFLSEAYANPTKRDLPALAAGAKGFTALATGPDGAGLDYVRDGLFDLAAMQPVGATGGPETLAPLFDAVVARARADAGAVAIVFGQSFADRGADATFGFSPEQGVHDIHMMQGNAGSFADDNTVNGDGALFVRFGGGGVFAFFARFATQSVTTDPATGAPA